MEIFEINILIIICILCLIYILTPINKTINNSLLNSSQSFKFEITEIALLIFLTYYYYKKNDNIISLVFFIAFIEHIRQITICYRQESGSIHEWITILIYLTMIIYSYVKNERLAILIFIIGIIIHCMSIFYNKSFSNLTCINFNQ